MFKLIDSFAPFFVFNDTLYCILCDLVLKCLLIYYKAYCFLYGPVEVYQNLYLIVFQDAYNNVSRDLKVTHLLATIHNGQQSEEARQMAAVLLRRLFTSEFLEFYKEVSKMHANAYHIISQVIIIFYTYMYICMYFNFSHLTCAYNYDSIKFIIFIVFFSHLSAVSFLFSLTYFIFIFAKINIYTLIVKAKTKKLVQKEKL